MVDYELRSARYRRAAIVAASPAPAPRPRPEKPPLTVFAPKPDLSAIARAIESAAGNAVPDGDPIDVLAPKLERMGIRRYDVSKFLDRAARKHLGVRSYSQYLEQLWDTYNEAVPEEDQRPNPWR